MEKRRGKQHVWCLVKFVVSFFGICSHRSFESGEVFVVIAGLFLRQNKVFLVREVDLLKNRFCMQKIFPN